MKGMTLVGKVQLENKVVVTDPSFELGDRGSYILNNVQDYPYWNVYIKPSMLVVVNGLSPKLREFDFKLITSNLWVASGRVSVCNLANYRPQDDYEKYTQASDNQLKAGIVGDYAAVAQTGMKGDALQCDLLVASTVGGEIVGIMVQSVMDYTEEDMI